jgi:hypothetical protein
MKTNKYFLKTDLKRMQKINTLAPIYDYIRGAKGKQIRVNEFWDNVESREKLLLPESWNTRAFFLQEFKRFAPDDIEIIKAQKAGTFAKVK